MLNVLRKRKKFIEHSKKTAFGIKINLRKNLNEIDIEGIPKQFDVHFQSKWANKNCKKTFLLP